MKSRNRSKIILCKFLLLIPLSVFGQDLKTPVGKIMNVSAPSLGITSSTVVLLWDDTYIPDYTNMDVQLPTRMYHIYRDGIKIGSTKQRSYPVKGLASSSTYSLAVQLSEGPVNMSGADNSIQITTKKAGKVFNVRKYGAKGDGQKLDTKSIQKAINACTKGGVVLIPAGTYLVDHIELKSEMSLELEKGARLNFLGYNEGGNYPVSKAALPGPDGIIDYASKYLITAYKVHDVTITGEGTINWNGETWWPYFRTANRPLGIGFIQSSNILVQGVTFLDSPNWNNHLLYSDSALYSDVKFFLVSKVPPHNSDGIDADASRHILVVGCLFGNQDDCFAVKSGNALVEGNKRRRSTEYITVRDCVFNGNAAPGSQPLGIAIGSEVSGGARHIVIQNCEFIDVASIIDIKTNRKRPYSLVEDVLVENISYTNTKFPERPYNRAPIAIDMFYYGKYARPDSIASLNQTTPLFRNIHLKNIRIENPMGKFVYLRGMPEQPIKNLTFENIAGSSKQGFYGKNVDGIDLINVKFKAEEGYFYNWTNVKGIKQSPR
jgi:polygalacturonase